MTFEDIKDIRAFIKKYVNERVSAGQVVNQAWATTDILSKYDDIEGDDKDFYLITAQYWVNEEVKAAIKVYEPKPEDNSQLVLEGFEYLQQAYPVSRGGVRCLVPVPQLSNDELDSKAFEYEKMGDGCYAHAAEIRSYKNNRQQTA